MKHEDKRIIDLLTKGSGQLKSNKLLSYSYISNPDQTIRWIYPTNQKIPTFLNFYHSSSLRSKTFTIVVRLLFIFRLSNLIRSNIIVLSTDKDSLLQTIRNRYPGYSYSIFTGTIGKNRKIIIELSKSSKSLVFAKVAISNTSRALIQNEFHVLSTLKRENLPAIHIPKVLNYNENGILEISNIKPNNYKQPSKLNDAHITALSEINNVNYTRMKWLNMSTKNEIGNLIHNISIKVKVDNGLSKQKVDDYLESIASLYEMIDDEKFFSCGLSHGDFTPWNMFIDNRKLYIYDWELSKVSIPVLFDMFHYVFQSEVLINHSDFIGVKNEIARVLSLTSTKKLINKYGVDVNMSYIFYLIYISSYYINLYIDQKSLHVQGFWLYQVWMDAISDALMTENGKIFD